MRDSCVVVCTARLTWQMKHFLENAHYLGLDAILRIVHMDPMYVSWAQILTCPGEEHIMPVWQTGWHWLLDVLDWTVATTSGLAGCIEQEVCRRLLHFLSHWPLRCGPAVRKILYTPGYEIWPLTGQYAMSLMITVGHVQTALQSSVRNDDRFAVQRGVAPFWYLKC